MSFMDENGKKHLTAAEGCSACRSCSAIVLNILSSLLWMLWTNKILPNMFEWKL